MELEIVYIRVVGLKLSPYVDSNRATKHMPMSVCRVAMMLSDSVASADSSTLPCATVSTIKRNMS